MASSTPRRNTPTPPTNLQAAPRRARPPKPSEKIREAQQSIGARANAVRTVQYDVPPSLPGASPLFTNNPSNNTYTLLRDVATRTESILIKVSKIEDEAEEAREERRIESERVRNTIESLIEALSTLKRREEDGQTLNEIKESQTSLQKVCEEMRAENEVVKSQNGELKRNLEGLKTQNEALKEELAALRTTLENNRVNTPSWAQVASQTGPAHTAPSGSHTDQAEQHGLPGINLDLASITNPQFDNTNVEEIRKRARQALDSYPSTKEIKWIGIAKRGTDGTKIRICMRNNEDAERAKTHDEWVRSHFRGARIQGEQWHRVKVDRVSMRRPTVRALGVQRDRLARRLRAPSATISVARCNHSQPVTKAHCPRLGSTSLAQGQSGRG
jgi:cell division septum initiation protein DivIVA